VLEAVGDANGDRAVAAATVKVSISGFSAHERSAAWLDLHLRQSHGVCRTAPDSCHSFRWPCGAPGQRTVELTFRYCSDYSSSYG